MQLHPIDSDNMNDGKIIPIPTIKAEKWFITQNKTRCSKVIREKTTPKLNYAPESEPY